MRRGFEPDVAAVAARHIARDRQAEPDAAGRRVARGIEADEGLEHPLAFAGRDAGPVIVDQDVDAVLDRRRSTARHAAITAGIGDQVGEAAAQRVRPTGRTSSSAGATVKCAPVAPRRGRRDPRSAARYRSRPGFRCPRRGRNRDSTLTSRSISATSDFSSADDRVVAEQFERQLHPGQRRAQIVRHAGEHLGALADLALDAVAHLHEGGGGLAHFERALDLGERRPAGPCRTRRRPPPAGAATSPDCAERPSRPPAGPATSRPSTA